MLLRDKKEASPMTLGRGSGLPGLKIKGEVRQTAPSQPRSSRNCPDFYRTEDLRMQIVEMSFRPPDFSVKWNTPTLSRPCSSLQAPKRSHLNAVPKVWFPSGGFCPSDRFAKVWQNRPFFAKPWQNRKTPRRKICQCLANSAAFCQTLANSLRGHETWKPRIPEIWEFQCTCFGQARGGQASGEVKTVTLSPSTLTTTAPSSLRPMRTAASCVVNARRHFSLSPRGRMNVAGFSPLLKIM